MGYLFDIAILVILYFFARKNSHKKQIRVILETVSFVLAAAVAIPIAVFCSGLTWSYWFREPLANDIAQAVADTPFIVSGDSNTGRILEQFPSTVRNAAEEYQLTSAENVREVERNLVGDTREAPQRIADILARPVIEGILRGVLCILFFYAALFLFKALAAFAENLIKSPDRMPANVVLCGAMGVFKGLVILMLFTAALQFIVPALPIEVPMFSPAVMDHSVIFRLLCRNNSVLLFLGRGVFPMALN